MAQEIVLVAPVRTAIGSFNGVFKQIDAVALGAAVIQETVTRTGADPARIGSVVMGNVVQAGNRMNPARQASIHAGLPVSVPAQTVNRVCGSGAQAIVSVAQEIASGQHRIGVAGGMENMDRAPYLFPQGRWGKRMGDAQLIDSMLHDGLHDAFSAQHSGWHTEDLASRFGISREAQDGWAARSHQRFATAAAAGHFAAEIVPVRITANKQDVDWVKDEGPRPETTAETLARLRPAFRPDGTITAGNAPGLNSAAAAVVVAERGALQNANGGPMARLRGYSVVGVDPDMFGIGPAPAIRALLERTGWALSDVDRFEINEAFAAVTLAVVQELGLPEDVVNVDGGAIAHGHAIGATGAVLTSRLLHSLRRDNLKKGVVALCIGGGQGIALAVEMVE